MDCQQRKWAKACGNYPAIRAGRWMRNSRQMVKGLSGDDKSMILTWDVDTGEVVMSWEMLGLLAGGFNDTEWSPDGQFVVIHGTGDIPYIKRAWQSTEELIDYAYDCCVKRELTPEEREQFGLLLEP